MQSRFSLRVRLLVGVFVLAAVGLVTADVVTYGSLRSFLVHRVDATLAAGHPQVEQGVFGPPGGGPRGGNQGPPAEGIDWYQVRTVQGTTLASGFLVGGGSPPSLPARIILPAGSTDSDGDRVTYFTVNAKSGGGLYRIRASIESQRPSDVLIVASSLSDVEGTLHRLLLIELLVTAAVLAAIGGLGFWVIRLGLRPLREIEATAAAIAEGDLSRRVERAETRTEVGRLGLSLNAMLGQIESAFKVRESSEQKLRRFVADASHELRTPLAAVRAYAELFERGAAARPDDLARSMDGITREAQRMSLLVEDLLLLARLDEGRPLEQDEVDLGEVVAEAVDAARAVDPGRPLELNLERVIVTGDRDRLRQSIDNLFSNIRAHTPPESPVRVDVRAQDGRAVVSVGDSGPGLTPEQASQVFERFYRADSSRARASGGVGLGLAIVAAVVHAHGGEVSANSVAGEGATFRIELPLAPAAGEASLPGPHPDGRPLPV